MASSLARSNHPSSPYRRNPKMAQRAPASSSGHPPDPYYGNEETAKVCARFVTHLFACPDLPPPSSSNPPTPSPPLAMFIAYALHRTRLHASVTFAALYLLQRLKARFPAARGSSGHRLFISAFMLASKVICDDTYSNKSWSIVGQGMFALREINQMEREMCSYLEWQLNVEPTQLREFEGKVRKDFKGQGPYPNYSLPSPAPSPMPSTTPYGHNVPLQTPSFVSGRPSTSPPKSALAHPPTSMPHPSSSSSRPYVHEPASPEIPDTPESYRSTSTSPASTMSPPTPPGPEDLNPRIVSPTDDHHSHHHHISHHHYSSQVPVSHSAGVIPSKAIYAAAPHDPPAVPMNSIYAPPSSSHLAQKKSKVDADLFAVAMPVSW